MVHGWVLILEDEKKPQQTICNYKKLPFLFVISKNTGQPLFLLLLNK